jgi:hypothetical protein
MAENLGQVDIILKPDMSAMAAAQKQATAAFSGAAPPGKVGPPNMPGVPGTGGGSPGAPGGMGGGKGPTGASKAGGLGGLSKWMKGGLIGAGIFVAFKALSKITNTLLNGFDQFAKRMAGFNPNLAMANVTSFVRKLKRDMSMAKAIGADYLELTKLKEDLFDSLQPFKELWATIKIHVMKAFVQALQLAVDALLFLAQAISALLKFILMLMQAIMEMANWFSSWFMGWEVLPPGGVFSLIGALLNSMIISIDELVEEVKKGRDEDREIEMNAELTRSLEKLSNRSWEFGKQIPGGGYNP